MNETETRAELIDPALTQASWRVMEESRIRREDPITKGCIQAAGNESVLSKTPRDQRRKSVTIRQPILKHL